MSKSFFALTLLLPLLAVSATAHAGSTITDKSYWPNAARPTVHGAVVRGQGGPRDAFASDNFTTRSEPMSSMGGNERRYHGGPKSPW